MYLYNDQEEGDIINVFKRVGTVFSEIKSYTITGTDIQNGYIIIRIVDTTISSENESFAFNSPNGKAGGCYNGIGTSDDYLTYYTNSGELTAKFSKWVYCIDFGYFETL